MSLLDLVLEPGSLTPLFQPIVEVHGESLRLHSYECLVKGPRDTNLEAAGVLFEYVRAKRAEAAVDRACITTSFLAAERLAIKPRLSVNVHACTLGCDPGFPAFLVATARAHGIDPARLTVEVVEHAPPWDTPRFLEALERLRQAGARIALDDVGLGQSNFRMILDTRPDYFKIDRYFVEGCHSDPYRRAVLESVVQLAGRFGGRVVAEGVSQLADFDAVHALGVDLVQGWLIAPALPIEALEGLEGLAFLTVPGRFEPLPAPALCASHS